MIGFTFSLVETVNTWLCSIPILWRLTNDSSKWTCLLLCLWSFNELTIQSITKHVYIFTLITCMNCLTYSMHISVHYFYSNTVFGIERSRTGVELWTLD